MGTLIIPYMNILEVEDSSPCETCFSNETQTKWRAVFLLFLTTKHAPNIFKEFLGHLHVRVLPVFILSIRDIVFSFKRR
jgi:hypothetical protein